MPPTLLITRPAPGGASLATAIAGLPGGDLRMILSPVTRIEGAGPLPDLAGVRWLIFTSPAGVRRFAQLCARRDIPVYAVGDGTARAAQEAGMTAISCGGDAGRLIECIVTDGAQGPMLHLRGMQAAADIAGALAAHGIDAREAVIYRQMPQPLSAEALACLAGTAPVIAPVMSPQSAVRLFAGPPIAAPLIVLAISDAAAAKVPHGTAQEIIVADHPDLAGVLRAWPRALGAAYRLEGTSGAQ